MGDTRRRLIDGAIETVRAHGIAAVSARTIAATAGVNQALVFYHFDGVDNLLAQACQVTTEERVARFRERFAEVDSFSGLLALGARLHEDESEAGNVTVLAQMLAGAQRDPKLVEATGAAVQLWVTEIEHALRRLLTDSPLSGLLDPATLDELAKLVEVIDEPGPVARRVVRAKPRNTATKERA